MDKIKSLRWSSSISYDPSTVITYNLSIGAPGTDLARCWEAHPDFHAMPTFASVPVINIMGKVTRDMPSFLAPHFQPHKHPHVHGEHYLQLKTPFPTSGTLLSEARVIDVADRRTGVAVIIGISTRDAATGVEICYNEWTSFLIGMSMATTPSPKGLQTQQSKHKQEPGQHATQKPDGLLPHRKPDAVIRHQTTSEQGALYRAATGEWNPMHIDPETGRKAGFPGPILSGTCTIGIGVRHVLDMFAGGDSDRFASVRLRLSKPVFPGEVILTEMWREGESDGRTIVYQQKTLDGRVVIAQAMVRLGDSQSQKQTRL